ncbi:MAG: hypothetical protein LLG24_02205, partial [Actinomycetia bacterium]|nr:hypothetical protein [Actinomycetes bacterium]
RFLSPDPAPPSAGDPLSLNAYAYCQGDPVGASDPSGAVADLDGDGKVSSGEVAIHASKHTKNKKLAGTGGPRACGCTTRRCSRGSTSAV